MSSLDGTAPPAPSPANPATGDAPPPLRILVVDDDLINQRVLANLLKRKGWASALANSGRACLTKMAAESFDLVLLDIQMPELDGFETAALIRQDEQDRGLARTPIVALTALRQPETREKCLAAGMDDHLTKPVDTGQLYAAIQKILNLPG